MPLVLLALWAATGVPVADPLGAEELERLTARFAPVDLEVDIAGLPPGERRALGKIVEASRVLDAVYMGQVWAGNETVLLRLLGDTSRLGRARLGYFMLQRGPWDRQQDNRAFVPGVPPRPGGAGFYPPDSTKEEIATWIAGLKGDDHEAATSYFTTIRRIDGKLRAVPYSVEYGPQLTLAAGLLREAAAASAQPTLKAFLGARAAAFLSNDYRPSDVAWMKLDASIEPTLGPYEVYEDDWFNYKAAFESFVAVRDEAETRKLAFFSDHLQELENQLPIEPSLRNPKLGALSPIRVVNEVFVAGDANHGVQTAAYNLPNDEVVVKEMGSKRVMLRNVQKAKFDRVLLRIAAVALGPEEKHQVQFDAFFTWILMHELMHGLGPHDIVVSGRRSTVRQEMKEIGSALEEAKADISGLWALQILLDRGLLDESMQKTLYPTYLASLFRSLRFGLSEAHGRGTALQTSWLLDHGALAVGSDGTFRVVENKIRPAVESLTREIMTLQAHGDRAGAAALLDRMAVLRPEVKRVLDRLSAVPVDIAPRFVTAEKLIGR